MSDKSWEPLKNHDNYPINFLEFAPNFWTQNSLGLIVLTPILRVIWHTDATGRLLPILSYPVTPARNNQSLSVQQPVLHNYKIQATDITHQITSLIVTIVLSQESSWVNQQITSTI